MRIGQKIGFGAACVAWVGMACPAGISAADRPVAPATSSTNHPVSDDNARPAIQDIGLSGGALCGQVVNQQGVPVANALVGLAHQDQAVGSAVTNASGEFKLQNVHGGVYTVSTSGAAGMYRVWSEGTAPPGVKSQLMLVSGKDVIRGQMSGSPWGWVQNPWVILGAIAAAIAIPIAVANHNHGNGS